MRAFVMAGIVCSACSKPPADAPGTCLPLPAGVRTELIADPDGEGLYWLESVEGRNFEGELTATANLVHFNLRTRHLETVVERVARPVLFMRGKIVALRPSPNAWPLLLVDGPRVQELTPDYLDVLDVEELDDHTLALLAEGDGKRAVYTLDLDEPRPKYAIDASVLLSTSAGRIYVRQGDAAVVVDTTTRSARPITIPAKVFPNADGAVHITERKTIAVQSMSSGVTREVVGDARPWRLVHQTGSVLARTRPLENRSFAWLLAGGERQQLPTVLGGASIRGATLLGDQTWALIGHNTANFVGDPALIRAETDVCLLPASGTVTFDTRDVPARYLPMRRALFDELERATDNATLQILDWPGAPTTVSIRLKGENGARDAAAMRARVRELQRRITSLLGDREIRTEVIYADRQTAIARWRRSRLRDRVSTGMGDALVSDPASFDVEVRGLDNTEDGGRIRCAGTLANLTSRPLEGLSLRCSGNRAHVIPIPSLAPGATATFAQTFEIRDGEAPLFEAWHEGNELALRDATVEQRMQQVLDLAIAVHAETGLALESHDPDAKLINVDLVTSDAFEARDADKRKAAITRAYQAYEKLRDIYGLESASPLRVHVEVELTDVTYQLEGTNFTRRD